MTGRWKVNLWKNTEKTSNWWLENRVRVRVRANSPLLSSRVFRSQLVVIDAVSAKRV